VELRARVSVEIAKANHMIVQNHKHDLIKDLKVDAHVVIVRPSSGVENDVSICHHNQQLNLHVGSLVEHGRNQYEYHSFDEEHRIVRNLPFFIKHAEISIKLVEVFLNDWVFESVNVSLQNYVEDARQRYDHEKDHKRSNNVVISPYDFA
jgi:hypothetical protein